MVASQVAPLQGRDAELARLERVCAVPDAGVRVVEISGDPWIGKTRLLSEFERLARSNGWAIASGKAGPLPADLPFGVFTESLDDLLASGDDDLLKGFAPDHVRWLAGIFPALASRAAQPAVPVGGSDLHHACRAVRTLLESLGRSRRLLLVLDDAQWADRASVHLLKYLLRHPPAADVVIVLVYRPLQLDSGLRELLVEMSAAGSSLRVDVPPLSERDLSALLPPDMNAFRRHTFIRQSGGNPGLLQGLVSVEDTVADTAAVAHTETLGVPVALLRDFRRVSCLGWFVLKAAALLPEPIDPDLLREVTQLGEGEIWASIDELLRHDILRFDEGGRTLRVRNPLLRAAAYQWAGAGWRLWMHARAAKVLSHRKAPSPQLAPHLVHVAAAGNEDSVRVLLDAARETLWHSPDRAALWARTACELRKLDGHSPGARDELLQATALALSGRLGQSLTILFRVRPAAPCDRAVATLWRTYVLRLVGRYAEADKELRELSAVLPERGAETTRLEVAVARLATALEIGEVPEQLQETARQGAESATDPFLRARLHALLAVAAAAGGRGELAGRRIDEAARLMDALPDDVVVTRLDCLDWLGRAEDLLGRADSGLIRLQGALDLAERRGMHSLVPMLAVSLASLLLRSDDPARAAYLIAQADHAAGRSSNQFMLARVARLRQEIRRRDLGALGEDLPLDRVDPPTFVPAADDQLAMLSNRERQIAVLVSIGRTNQQIARALGLSHKTVETYLARMFKKLQVGSRAQVAALVGRVDDVGALSV
ncbi:AAA family ATPase [Actinomadura viridis]|uniref:AAA family ATPase n=1 Tax=Actinomadura viridis TaxID=58110 RepID=UPI0036990BC7